MCYNKEDRSRKWLGEEVGEIVNCSNVWDHQATTLDHFPNEEVTMSNVFGAVMVLRIVGNQDPGLQCCPRPGAPVDPQE